MTPAVSDPLIPTVILLQPLHTATVLHTPVNASIIRTVCMHIRMFGRGSRYGNMFSANHTAIEDELALFTRDNF